MRQPGELPFRHQIEPVREGGEAAPLPVEIVYARIALCGVVVRGDESVREIPCVPGEHEMPARRHGLDRPLPPLATHHFRRLAKGQMDLF